MVHNEINTGLIPIAPVHMCSQTHNIHYNPQKMMPEYKLL